jgi:hypothetical protein
LEEFIDALTRDYQHDAMTGVMGRRKGGARA